MILGLLVLCAAINSIALGIVSIVLWALFSRVILRDMPLPTCRREAATQNDIEKRVVGTYQPADPWDELRIDRDDIPDVAPTIQEEDGYYDTTTR